MRAYSFTKGDWRLCRTGKGVNLDELIKVLQKPYIGFVDRNEYDKQASANSRLFQRSKTLVDHLEKVISQLKQDNEDGHWQPLITEIENTLDYISEGPKGVKDGG